MTRPLTRAAAAVAVVVLLVSGCSVERKAASPAKPPTSSSPAPVLPTGDVTVPAGVSLTEAGAVLKFGEPARVAYQPNAQRKSVLELTVTAVQEARIADFAGYQLSDETKRSRPYYVRVSARNVGTGDLSRTGIPVFAVDDTNALNQQTSFNNTYKRCPSQPLPAAFTAGKSLSTCLVYVLRPGRTLTKVSYRPLQAFPPITWAGTVAPPPVVKKKKGTP